MVKKMPQRNQNDYEGKLTNFELKVTNLSEESEHIEDASKIPELYKKGEGIVSDILRLGRTIGLNPNYSVLLGRANSERERAEKVLEKLEKKAKEYNVNLESTSQ